MQNCRLLKEKNWVHHSDLKKERVFATAITMAKGTFIFGGQLYPNTWEWLPSGSSTWVHGGSIPDPGFEDGCGVQISSQEILLIGGLFSKSRILKFNVETEEWTEMDEKIQPGRFAHSCVVFKNNIIVSGGRDWTQRDLKSTQLFNKGNLTSSYGSDMQQARMEHGLVVAHYNNQPTVLAIGGNQLETDSWERQYTDSVEVWDPESKTWSLSSDLAISEAKAGFGALSVPTHLVCP